MRLVRLAVAVIGLALGLGTFVLVRASPGGSFAGRSLGAAIILVGTGVFVMAVGLVAWQRNPGRRYGPLMVAAGLAWLIAEWNNLGVGSAAVFTVGLVFHATCAPLVAHAALVYPDGRLTSRLERVVLAIAYAGAFLGLGLLPALFFQAGERSCALCPTNLVAIAGNADLVHTFNGAGQGLAIGWALALALLIVWRLVRSTPAAQRVKAPVLAPAAGFLCLVAAGYLHLVARGTPAIDSLDRQLRLAQAAALAALAGGVAWEWVRARRARSAMAALVVELGEAPPPGGLRAALADALGDPDLVVAYPLSDGRLVDADGHPVDHAEGGQRVATDVVRDGRPVVRLLHRRELLARPGFVEEVASAAGLALESERLRAEVAAQLADLRASRTRIVEGGDDERRRLERDLHDGAQQRLVGLALAIRLLRSQLDQRAAPATLAVLDEAETELRGAVTDLRGLAHGLHPAVLSSHGLAAALESLSEEAPVRLGRVPGQRLPHQSETAAYFLVAEAAKAGAVRVNASLEDGILVVHVDADRRPDYLIDLDDRIGALDGRLIVSDGPNGRVRLQAEIPCG